MAIVKADIPGAEDGAFDAAGRSTRIPEATLDCERGPAGKPPYKLDALAQFPEVNSCRTRCCKAKAIAAAGLRHDLLGKLEELGRLDKVEQVIDEPELPAFSRTRALDCSAGSVEAIGDVPDIRVRRREEK